MGCLAPCLFLRYLGYIPNCIGFDDDPPSQGHAAEELFTRINLNYSSSRRGLFKGIWCNAPSVEETFSCH